MNVSDSEQGEDLQSTLLEADRLSEAGQDAEALELLLAAEQRHADDPTLLCMIGALAGQLGVEGMALYRHVPGRERGRCPRHEAGGSDRRISIR